MILLWKNIPPFKRVGEKNTSFHRSPASLKFPMMLLCKGTYALHFKEQRKQCPRHAPRSCVPAEINRYQIPKLQKDAFLGNYELQSHHYHQVPLAPILQAFWNFHSWNEPLQCSNNPPQYFGSKLLSIQHQFTARLRSNHLLCHCVNTLSL